MALESKLRYILGILYVMTTLFSCVTFNDELTPEDIEIVSIEEPYSKTCRFVFNNAMKSPLMNLNDIQWTERRREGNTFYAVSPNANGNDTLIIDIPVMMENVFTNFEGFVYWKANKTSSDKILIIDTLKRKRYNSGGKIGVDTRGDSITIAICDYPVHTKIAGQDVKTTVSTVISYPK